MAGDPSPQRRFLAELKRRKVFRVMAVYGAVAFGIIQIADPVTGALQLPGWLLPTIIVLLLLGFPVAVVLAWALEVTPDGVRRTDPDPDTTRRIAAEPPARRWLPGIVALAGVLAMVLGAWFVGRRTAPIERVTATHDSAAQTEGAEAAVASIAVLPFADMSPGRDQGYFSDGITEELLNVLAQLPELRVPARTSAFAFRDSAVGIDSIARALGVRHILEGSVRRADEQVRITAQLIDASTGYHLWSETYDRTLDDVFAVQDEIARAIVDALPVELTGRDTLLVRVPTSDPEAHTLVLRARQLMQQGQDPAAWLPQAERLYEQAIARDSSYAAAWAGLANIHRLQAQWGFADRDAALEAAEAGAERALRLDPDESDAHLALGSVARVREDLDSAARHYREAQRLNPNDPRTLSFYVLAALHDGDLEEARSAALKAVELDPLSVNALYAAGNIEMTALQLEAALRLLERGNVLAPDDPFILRTLGLARLIAGQRDGALELADRLAGGAAESPTMLVDAALIRAYARDVPGAVTLLRRAVELAPRDPHAQANLGSVLSLTGDHDGAIRHARRAVELAPEETVRRAILGYVLAVAGQRDAALDILEQMPDEPRLPRAAILARLGETDRAFAALERAVEEREFGVIEFGADWWFDTLRGDPRMVRLLDMAGVADVATRYQALAP